MHSTNTPQYELGAQIVRQVDATVAPNVLVATNCVYQSKDIKKGRALLSVCNERTMATARTLILCDSPGILVTIPIVGFGQLSWLYLVFWGPPADAIS